MPPGCGDPAAVRAFGVVFSMLGWPGGDYLAWAVAWLALSGYAFRMSGDARRFIPGVRPRPRVGVAHGVSAGTHRRVHRHAPRQSPDHDLEPRIALVPIQNPNSGSLSTRSGLTAVAMLTCLGVAFSELRAGEWPFGGCAASGPYALVRGSRALRASLCGAGEGSAIPAAVEQRIGALPAYAVSLRSWRRGNSLLSPAGRLRACRTGDQGEPTSRPRPVATLESES
jgi:hypothetical protein